MYWPVRKLVKYEQKQFCPIIFFLWVKLNLKLSLLVKSELLGHFVNTLAADDKYY